MGLFDGIKIVDFTHAYAGPFFSQMMGDFGAEVIKIERTEGDQARTWGPFKNDYSAYFAGFNRAKKSITIDIKSKEGQKIIFDLVKDADIVCCNFKNGTLEKYGIGYEDVKKIKPDIIYASISGFGEKGAFSKLPAYDNVVQAMSGIMDINGFSDKNPTKIGPAIGDSYTGLMLLLGVMMALYERKKTGLGQKVDASMLGSLYTTLEYPILEYTNAGKFLSRTSNANYYYAPCDTFKVKDGYMTISVKNDAMWKTFVKAAGFKDKPEYADSKSRLANRDILKSELESFWKDMTRAEIEKSLENTDIPNSGVINIVESLTDEQLLARDMVIEVEDPVIGPINLVGNPLKLSGRTVVTDIPSPTLGQHTNEILESLGYSEEDISSFRLAGVI